MVPVAVPVLVVGAGPAGLTTALLLAGQGTPVLCVERRTDVSPLPRARGVHARATEILRVCRAEAEMRRRALSMRPGVEWRPTLGAPAVRALPTGGPEMTEISPCEGMGIAQDVFETVLRQRLREHDLAELRLGTELESFTTVGDGVEAVLLDRATGERATVRAGHLVGADGWRSSVRQGLGIGLVGPADLGSRRSVTFRADLSAWSGTPPIGLYFLTDANGVLLWTHPDDRWVLFAVPGPEPAGDLVRTALGLPPATPVEVLTDTVWTAAAQRAERFAAGRAFLVGDAAHRVPPAGATGVSSAMADAVNLAWKLTAAHRGYAGAGLLDTYAVEREAVARVTTDEARVGWLAMQKPDGAAFTGRSLRQLDMGYQYRSAAVLADGPLRDDSGDYVPNADPGSRAPHLRLQDGRSTIDLVGREFTVLTAAPLPAPTGPVPLHVHHVDAPGFTELYGIGPDGAVLVRPDGHVAWRAQAAPTPAALAGALHRVLGQRPPPMSSRAPVT